MASSGRTANAATTSGSGTISGAKSFRAPCFVWIGERSEYETTDFDGRLRRGVVLRSLDRSPWSSRKPVPR